MSKSKRTTRQKKGKLLFETADGVLLPVERVQEGDTLLVQVDEASAAEGIKKQFPARLQKQVFVYAASDSISIDVEDTDNEPQTLPQAAPVETPAPLPQSAPGTAARRPSGLRSEVDRIKREGLNDDPLIDVVQPVPSARTR